jgi:ribosomal protein L13E
MKPILITNKTHKKTLIKFLNTLNKYDLWYFEDKITAEEKEVVEASENEFELFKDLIISKYLADFKPLAIKLSKAKIEDWQKKEAENAKIKKAKAEVLTIKEHHERLFANRPTFKEFETEFEDIYTDGGHKVANWKTFYEKVYNINPKVDRGFTKAEIKKLGLKLKDCKQHAEYLATKQELLNEQTFEFAEDIVNELERCNDRLDGGYCSEDRPLHEPFNDHSRHGYSFSVNGTVYLRSDRDSSYHLNEKHSKLIDDIVKEAEYDYFCDNIESETEDFSNFQEYWQSLDWKEPEKDTLIPYSKSDLKILADFNNENERKREEYFEYEDEILRDSVNAICFELSLTEEHAILTANYALDCAFLTRDRYQDILRYAIPIADFKEILKFNDPFTNNNLFSYQDIIDKTASLIYKCAKRDKLFTNKLYKKLYA